MKTTLRALILLFTLGGWILAGAALHVVRYADDRIGILPKNRLGIDDTYIDTRAWTEADNERHADFVARLTEAGKTHWLVPATQADTEDMAREAPTKSKSKPAAHIPKAGVR